jgi:hypothetical protein
MYRLVFATALLASPLVAYAQKAPDPVPHTVDMTAYIRDAQGKSILDFMTRADADDAQKDPACTSCKPLTMGALLARALVGSYKGEETLDLGQRIARAVLAQRIKDQTAAALSADDVKALEHVLQEAQLSGDILVQIVPVIDPNYKVPALN